MAVLATHDSNITITITLSPAPTDGSDFNTPIRFVPLATNSLNGDVVRSYASDDDAAADLAAGYISAATRAALQDGFSQIPKPPTIKLASVDIVGGDSYADAYAAAKLVDDAFYFVTIESRVDADILLMSAAVEADRRIFILQSDDSDWLTSGYPAGLAALETSERSVTCYHDDDTDNMDLVFACARGVFDPAVQSAPWIGQLREVDEYAAMTAGQRAFGLANDANLMLPFGSITKFAMEGTNCNGRPISHIVTMDWLYYWLQQDLIALIASEAAAGRKLTVNDEGQSKGLAVIESRLQQAVGAGHLSGSEDADGYHPPYVINPVTITQTNRDDGELPYTGVATLTVGAVKVNLTLNLSTTPIT
jgi:hypothetical protein